MRWPRDVWIDAVMRSRLLPLERLVAVVYSRRAGPNDVVWVGTADLIEETHLSRNAARRALRGLVDATWLVLVERERQQRPARYRMVVPSSQGVTSGPPQGVTSGPPENPGGQLRTPSGGHLVTPGGPERTPGGHLRTPNHVELEEPPPSTPVSDLWLVVVDALPQTLARSLTRTRRLDDLLAQLHVDGWTPAVLGERVRSRGWDGCQAGAVVIWLSSLSPPTTPWDADPQTFERCTVYGHEHAVVTAAGCAACRFDHLGETG